MLAVSYKPDREPYVKYFDEQRAFLEIGEVLQSLIWSTEYVFFKLNGNDLNLSSYESIFDNYYRIGVIKGYSYFE